jgi:hypothetical protein
MIENDESKHMIKSGQICGTGQAKSKKVWLVRPGDVFWPTGFTQEHIFSLFPVNSKLNEGLHYRNFRN